MYNPPDASDADSSDATSDNATSSMDTSDAAAADARDTHAFQLLSRGDGDLTTTNACEIAVDGPPDVLEDPAEHSIEFDSHFSDASSVVVNPFPFGNPGAPIPGVPEGTSEQVRATPDEIWAPFRSERDWVIARWAKMRTTASGVAEFLAFPQVSASQSCHPLCP